MHEHICKLRRTLYNQTLGSWDLHSELPILTFKAISMVFENVLTVRTGEENLGDVKTFTGWKL